MGVSLTVADGCVCVEVEGLATGQTQGKLELLYLTSKCYGINADNIKKMLNTRCVLCEIANHSVGGVPRSSVNNKQRLSS